MPEARPPNAIMRRRGSWAPTDEITHGILNVGIFGEGVDAPALSAVGFLEARKSPVDVIQAVGRVMRRAEDKEMGYIICPILIPPRYRRRDVASKQRPRRRLEGTRTDIAGPQGP